MSILPLKKYVIFPLKVSFSHQRCMNKLLFSLEFPSKSFNRGLRRFIVFDSVQLPTPKFSWVIETWHKTIWKAKLYNLKVLPNFYIKIWICVNMGDCNKLMFILAFPLSKSFGALHPSILGSVQLPTPVFTSLLGQTKCEIYVLSLLIINFSCSASSNAIPQHLGEGKLTPYIYVRHVTHSHIHAQFVFTNFVSPGRCNWEGITTVASSFQVA